MKVYNYDANGYFTSAGDAQASPLEPGKFLIPGNATIQAPPAASATQEPKWNGTAWALVNSRSYLAQQAQQAQAVNALGVLLNTLDVNGIAQPRAAADILADGMAVIRADRGSRLAATDWLIARNSDEAALSKATTLSASQMAELLNYRKALRDLPSTVTDPLQVSWPTKPSFV